TPPPRDDQVETVLMGAMRDAGARGLAGLRAPSDVLRPLIDVRRTDLEAYAKAHGLKWVDDPTNRRSAYLRNRIRRDLLPALVRVRGDFDAELIEIGERAAVWRRDLAAMVERMVPFEVKECEGGARQLDV